ncbi:MAG TPA: glutathione S-transferase family protein, partial [Hyphomicrobiaceae bacterium]|nr:glutathione S-transferase family protein [Hyphomicrobiaceae bacterium]
YDLHVMAAVQAVVGDRLKPQERRDPVGVEQSFRQLAGALALVEKDMSGGKTWAMGEQFTMADCAAAPALFYANMLAPFGGDLVHAKRYLERLTQRPSYARALEDARPYLHFVPV